MISKRYTDQDVCCKSWWNARLKGVEEYRAKNAGESRGSMNYDLRRAPTLMIIIITTSKLLTAQTSQGGPEHLKPSQGF